MPDDGVPRAGAESSRRRHSEAARHSRLRKRRRRIMWVAHAVTAAMHAPLLLGATLLFGAPAASVICAGLVAVTAIRLQRILSEGRRSRVHTLLVDMPVFVHWSASLLASFVLWPVALLLAFVANALWGFSWG